MSQWVCVTQGKMSQWVCHWVGALEGWVSNWHETHFQTALFQFPACNNTEWSLHFLGRVSVSARLRFTRFYDFLESATDQISLITQISLYYKLDVTYSYVHTIFNVTLIILLWNPSCNRRNIYWTSYSNISMTPLVGGGRYKFQFLQVDWLSPLHGSKATALKGLLCEVEARL